MRSKQQGSTLLFTMIVLASLLFGMLSLAQSTVMASSVVTTIAQKASSTNAGDIGLNAAIAQLNATTDFEAATANYYPTQRKTNSSGVVCSYSEADTSSCPADSFVTTTFVTAGTSKVYYVIDRLCGATLSGVIDASTVCLVDSDPTLNNTQAIFYRVTIKVVGSEGTVSYIQNTLTKVRT